MCKCVNNIYKSERVLLPFPSYKWSCSNMTRLLCYEVAYAFYNHNQSLLFRPKEVCNGIKYTFRFSNSNTITRHLWKNLMHSFPTISLLSKCKWFGESPLPVVPIPAEIPFGLSKASKSLQKFHRVFMIKHGNTWVCAEGCCRFIIIGGPYLMNQFFQGCDILKWGMGTLGVM